MKFERMVGLGSFLNVKSVETVLHTNSHTQTQFFGRSSLTQACKRSFFFFNFVPLPSGKLTWLAGKSHFQIGNTSTQSRSIFQPAMLVYWRVLWGKNRRLPSSKTRFCLGGDLGGELFFKICCVQSLVCCHAKENQTYLP